jgi:hypothetical protein
MRQLPIDKVSLAKKVIAWLEDLKWDVYQEVSIGSESADIVGVQGRLTWIIECKTSMTIAVVAQADRWKGFAHYLSVAVPYGRHHPYWEKVLKDLGIGILWVARGDSYEWKSPVYERIKPKLWRSANLMKELRASLHPMHKTYAEAGNSRSRRWSPFKETCANIRRYVTDHSGATLHELLRDVETHYQTIGTARACIPMWADAGKIEGVRSVKEEGKWRFYTADGVVR